jgi:hypothetical protein
MFRLSAILLVFLFLGTQSQGWELDSGQKIRGKAVSFDYEAKSLGIEDAVTGKVSQIPAENLSLRSRQFLLFSRIFHESYPSDDGWPEEKYYLLRLAIFSPMAALLIGFWVGGMLIAKKFNPVRAILGFFGGWMIGGIFIFFYLFFAGRFGGGMGTVLFGAFLGTVFLSLFISVVYLCNVWKALLIFLFQILAAAFLSIVSLALVEVFVPLETREAFWSEHVFEPVGLVNPPPSPFQTGTP